VYEDIYPQKPYVVPHNWETHLQTDEGIKLIRQQAKKQNATAKAKIYKSLTYFLPDLMEYLSMDREYAILEEKAYIHAKRKTEALPIVNFTHFNPEKELMLTVIDSFYRDIGIFRRKEIQEALVNQTPNQNYYDRTKKGFVLANDKTAKYYGVDFIPFHDRTVKLIELWIDYYVGDNIYLFPDRYGSMRTNSQWDEIMKTLGYTTRDARQAFANKRKDDLKKMARSMRHTVRTHVQSYINTRKI
jgi:hypothetical protein